MRQNQIRHTSKVIFLSFYRPDEKVKHIVNIAYAAFGKNEPIHFLTDSKAATAYIDTLLWRAPKESFLPHGPGELITIGEGPIPEDTFLIFNTTKKPYAQELGIATTIYELEDAKGEFQGILKEKYDTYTRLGWAIVNG